MCSLVHLSGHGLQEKEMREQKGKRLFKEANSFVICNKSIRRSINSKKHLKTIRCEIILGH